MLFDYYFSYILIDLLFYTYTFTDFSLGTGLYETFNEGLLILTDFKLLGVCSYAFTERADLTEGAFSNILECFSDAFTDSFTDLSTCLVFSRASSARPELYSTLISLSGYIITILSC